MTDIKEKVKELIAAPSCCATAKMAAQNWLNAEGENKKAAAEKLITELEADLMTVDDVIAFMGTDTAAEHLGADMAKNILAHAKAIKAEGAVYCDCPACVAAKAILDRKNEL